MSKIRLYGDTSGFVELAAPDVSDDGVLVLPTAAQGFGLPRNVVQTVKSDVFTTSSTSFVDITGLAATITPSTSTSKILLIVSLQTARTTGTNSNQARLRRDSTTIAVGDAAGSRTPLTFSQIVVGTDEISTVTYTFLDSPATTDPVVYAAQYRVSEGSGSVFINRSSSDADTASRGRAQSSITLIEVAA
jgi:hypothetical protein